MTIRTDNPIPKHLAPVIGEMILRAYAFFGETRGCDVTEPKTDAETGLDVHGGGEAGFVPAVPGLRARDESTAGAGTWRVFLLSGESEYRDGDHAGGEPSVRDEQVELTEL